MQKLAPTIVYAMAKEGVYVPNTHPSVASAVREAEKALAHGLPLKVAVAFAINKANNNATAALSTAKLIRRVN